MSDFVLVHGSWMGAWAWDRVVAGHRPQPFLAAPDDLAGYLLAVA